MCRCGFVHAPVFKWKNVGVLQRSNLFYLSHQLCILFTFFRFITARNLARLSDPFLKLLFCCQVLFGFLLFFIDLINLLLFHFLLTQLVNCLLQLLSFFFFDFGHLLHFSIRDSQLFRKFLLKFIPLVDQFSFLVFSLETNFLIFHFKLWQFGFILSDFLLKCL